MRDIKTLLELLLDQYQNNRIGGIQWSGLCWAIQRLRERNIISLQEDGILTKYLCSNKPRKAGAGHWWPAGETKPRIKFIKQLISKLENETWLDKLKRKLGL